MNRQQSSTGARVKRAAKARGMSETRWRLVVHGGAGSMRPGQARSRAGSAARADGLEAALAAGSAILAEARERARRGRSGGASARGRPLLQRRARKRPDRERLRRARRRDHGRPRPRRAGAVSGLTHHARADQPRAAADGARAARLPDAATAPTISRATMASSRSTNHWFEAARAAAPAGRADWPRAGSTTRSNMARSARSRSTSTAMSRPRPRPAA